MLFVGDDWAQDHHGVEIQDEARRRVAKARLPEGAAGWPGCMRSSLANRPILMPGLTAIQ